MCSASEEEVGGSAALNYRTERKAEKEIKLMFHTGPMCFYDLNTRSVWAYLAVVEVTGRAVGISPEQSGEQTEGWRRRGCLCLQWALWFGGQTASAPLQTISPHHCKSEKETIMKRLFS